MATIYPSRHLVIPNALINKRAPAVHDLRYYESLIDGRQGYNLTWARAVTCTCRANTQTEQPDPTCAVCGGLGWRYIHPHPELFREDCDADGSVDFEGGEKIRGLVQAMRSNPRRQEKAGEWHGGTAKATVRPDVLLGQWDRLVMVDSLMVFDQLLKRSGASVSVGWDKTTRLRYPAVEVLDARTTASRYRERTHYTLADGTLTWVTGQGPATDELFSLRYRFHPRWIVLDFPRSAIGYRRPPKQTGLPGDTYTELPLTATIKLDMIL